MTGDVHLASAATGVAWPAVLTAAGTRLLSLLTQLDRTQWWPSEAVAERQWTQLNLSVSHAAATVPFYADWLRSGGWAPGTSVAALRDGWRAMPVLTRAEAQEAGEALWSRAVPDDHGPTAMMSTSGSTGRPLRTLTTQLAQLFWSALTLRDHLWQRRDFNLTHAAIRERPDLAPDGDGVAMSPWGRGVFRSGPSILLPISHTIREQAEWLTRHRPAYLLTYPSNLRALASHFAESGTALEGLVQARTVGEAVDASTRRAVRDAWSVPVVDIYSSQEAGYIALQCPEHEHYHVQSESVLVEVLDDDGEPCAEGQAGRVVVSTLHNFATPLLRYDVGDFAEVGPPCRCGRGLPVFTRVLGRERNVFVGANGERRWPSLGDAVAFRRAIGEGFPRIWQYQVVQRALDAVEMKLVVDRPLTADEEKCLHDHLQATLLARFALTLTYLDEIPRGPGGKFEDFRSEVST